MGLFGFFNKKDVANMKEEVKSSFDIVKTDIEKIGQWVSHLNNQDESHSNNVSGLNKEIASIKTDISELKDMLSLFSEDVGKQLFKTTKPRLPKQTTVFVDQTGVETPVQTASFYGISNLSVTERAIVWMLANNDMKLSYEDLAAMLGKTKSTIRGQINSIKTKSEGLILEYVERNGKKRVYMPEEIREKILKKAKVRIKRKKKEEN